MIKAMLVDLDGTLVDTVPALFQVYKNFLAHYGKEGTKEEFESLIGPSIDEIVAILQKKHELQPSLRDLSNMYVSTLIKQGFEGTELFPDAKNVLEEAKKRGIKLGIVTSGTKALVKICLDPFKITEIFDIVITSEDVSKTKPDPEMYELALKKLELDPSEAVAIEDSVIGQQAAEKAGIQVMLITHGKSSSLKGSQSGLEVKSWKDIGSWLNSQ